MLQNFLLGLGIALLLAAGVAIAAGAPAPAIWGTLVLGLMFTLGVLYEKVQYKPILDRLPPGNWQDTGERFIDPSSRRAVFIYANSATGKRIYLGGERRPDAD